MRTGDGIGIGLRCVDVHRARTIGFRCRKHEGERWGSPETGEIGNWESYWLIEFGESLAMKLAVRCCRIQF